MAAGEGRIQRAASRDADGSVLRSVPGCDRDHCRSHLTDGNLPVRSTSHIVECQPHLLELLGYREHLAVAWIGPGSFVRSGCAIGSGAVQMEPIPVPDLASNHVRLVLALTVENRASLSRIAILEVLDVDAGADVVRIEPAVNVDTAWITGILLWNPDSGPSASYVGIKEGLRTAIFVPTVGVVTDLSSIIGDVSPARHKSLVIRHWLRFDTHIISARVFTLENNVNVRPS